MAEIVCRARCLRCQAVVDVMRRGNKLSLAAHKHTRSTIHGSRDASCPVRDADVAAAVRHHLANLDRDLLWHSKRVEEAREKLAAARLTLAAAEAGLARASETHLAEVAAVAKVTALLGEANHAR